MATEAKAIRKGFHTVTPYLIVRGAAEAIEYYRRAFGAEELSRQADLDGGVRHAEMRIGDSTLMLTDESPEFPDWKGPLSRGGTPLHLTLYVPDVDAVFARAIAAGATVLLPVKDQDYGDRSGGLTDPFGHIWYVATPMKEDP